jgi:hypothetical protein
MPLIASNLAAVAMLVSTNWTTNVSTRWPEPSPYVVLDSTGQWVRPATDPSKASKKWVRETVMETVTGEWTLGKASGKTQLLIFPVSDVEVRFEKQVARSQATRTNESGTVAFGVQVTEEWWLPRKTNNVLGKVFAGDWPGESEDGWWIAEVNNGFLTNAIIMYNDWQGITNAVAYGSGGTNGLPKKSK